VTRQWPYAISGHRPTWSRLYLRSRSSRGRSPHFAFVHAHAPPSLCSTALCRRHSVSASHLRPPPGLDVASPSFTFTPRCSSTTPLSPSTTSPCSLSPVPLHRHSSASSLMTSRSGHLPAPSLPPRAPSHPRVLRHLLQLQLHPLLRPLTDAPLHPTTIAVASQAPVGPLPVWPPNRILLSPTFPDSPSLTGRNQPASHRLPLFWPWAEPVSQARPSASVSEAHCNSASLYFPFELFKFNSN
jgi:hypothetical protein